MEPKTFPEEERQQIVSDVVAEFPCFGKGTTASPSNPIHTWTRDEEPTFALGVPVRKVVDYVLSRIEETL